MADTNICKTPQNSKNISAEHTADIYTCIETCAQYALKNGLCMPEDEYYVRNGLLALFKLDAPSLLSWQKSRKASPRHMSK